MASPKRFVLWSAVSSKPQTEKVSLEHQIEMGRHAAEKWGGVVVDELIVPGESRSIVRFEDAAKRLDAYGRLEKLINERSFDVLVFLDLTRLGRKASLIMTILGMCHEAGIITYDLDSPPLNLDKPNSGEESMLMNAWRAVAAQRQVMKLAYHNTTGMIDRINSGDMPYYPPPWGWRVKEWLPGKGTRMVPVIEIDPQCQEIMLLIVDMYLSQGAGTPAIALELNARGYPPPRGREWHRTTIMWFLRRAWLFAGYVEINRKSKSGRPFVRAKSKWPALITESQAAALVAEQKRRTSARRSVGSKHLFSQCVFCAECDGRRMVVKWSVESSPGGGVYKRERYRCNNNHAYATISAKKIHAAVEAFLAHLSNKENRNLIFDDSTDRTDAILAEIANYESQLSRIASSIQRADSAWTDGVMDNERYRTQIDRLNTQRDRVLESLDAARSRLQSEEYAAQRPQRVETLIDLGNDMLYPAEEDIPAANAWWRQHIEIWVKDSQVWKIYPL